MHCPHCGIGISSDWDQWYEECYAVPNENDAGEGYKIISGFCPDCLKYILRLQHGYGYAEDHSFARTYCYLNEIDSEILLFPKFPFIKQISEYVPKQYNDLYKEAAQVNNISPRASATISRYLLQNILHEELEINKRTLEEEISALEEVQSIPSTLVAMLQVFRRIANFGAHPKKSTNSNEIVEIEKGEAEVMLELIEELFDFVFIKPMKQEEFLKSISEKYGIQP